MMSEEEARQLPESEFGNDVETMIIEEMAKGLSVDALPGLFSMTDDEFDDLIDSDPGLKRAIAVGEAKSRLYLERRALANAKTQSAILSLMLRNRLGWTDIKDGSDPVSVVQTKVYVNGSKEEKGNSDS